MTKSNLFTIMLLACGMISAQDSGTDATVIFNVNVIPMDSTRVLYNQTVKIESNRIVSIVDYEDADALKDIRGVINGTDKYLIPGLIDMHMHIREDRVGDLFLYLANGVTTVRNLHGSPWHIRLRNRIAEGEIMGPRFFTTGPTTYSANLEDTPEAAASFVLEQKKMGYNALKMYGTRPDYSMSSETYRMLLQTATANNIPVVGHTPRGIPLQEVLDAGQQSIDHLEEIYYGYLPMQQAMGKIADFQFGRISLAEYRQANPEFPDLEKIIDPLIIQLAGEIKASRTYITPSLIAFEAIVAQITPLFDTLILDERMNYIHPVDRLYWEKYNSYRGRWAGYLPEMLAIQQFILHIQHKMLREFIRINIPLMIGTDASLPFVHPGFSVHQEMALFVDYGASPFEALEAATVTPSKILGIEGEVGSIRPGKLADLVLLDDNPLEAIENTRKIYGVVAGGKWYSGISIKEELKNRADANQVLWKEIMNTEHRLQKGEVEAILKDYSKGGTHDDTFATYLENAVNRKGYEHVRNNNPEMAFKIFEWNTIYFPDSFNTWDSLAEMYMRLGNKEMAAKYYERSLDLNPENNNAREQLKTLHYPR